MEKVIDIITRVGQALLSAGERFASSPGYDGDVSYHALFTGEEDFMVWDDTDRSQWCARLDLDMTPSDPNRVSSLVTSVLGAPSRVNDNGTTNWDVDGVLVVGDNSGVEFFQDYARTPKKALGFNESWALLVELMEEEDFDADGDTSDEEQRERFDEVIAQWTTSAGPEALDALFKLVCSAGRDYYFSEYAMNAPGSRSSHRSGYVMSKTVAQNHARAILGRSKKGTEEALEIDAFLRENGHLLTEEYSQYTPAGGQLARDISARFPGLGKVSPTLVGVCEDRYGTKKMKNERSWNPEHMEYAGILLANARKKSKSK